MRYVFIFWFLSQWICWCWYTLKLLMFTGWLCNLILCWKWKSAPEVFFVDSILPLSTKSSHILLSLLISAHFIPSTCCPKTSVSRWIIDREQGSLTHARFGFTFSSFSITVAVTLSYVAFVIFRYIPSDPSFFRIFYHEGIMKFITCFSALNLWRFCFLSLHMASYTDWFAYVKPMFVSLKWNQLAHDIWP